MDASFEFRIFFLSNKSKGDRLTVPQIGKQNETNQPKCICGWYHNCMATDYSKYL